ncbi:hypothetical protein NN561_011546 [Cricetulus griseus]
MVYPYYRDKPAASKKQRMLHKSLPDEQEQETVGSMVFLEIDNRQCVQDSDQCFRNTDGEAALLASHSIQGTLSYPLMSFISEFEDQEKHPSSLSTCGCYCHFPVHHSAAVIMAKRKRKLGFLWLPECSTLRRDSSNHSAMNLWDRMLCGAKKSLSVSVRGYPDWFGDK